MARIETTVRIAAPVEVVFAFFVPQRMPYWYGSDIEASLEVQGGAPDFAIAQKVRVTGSLGKREVSHTAVVTELRPGKVFEWRFEDRYGVRGLERWEFESLDAAPSDKTGSARKHTIVRMLSDYTMPGFLSKAADWLITRHAVAQRNEGYLARLKRYAEHGEPE
jgi:uncharacterized membrane protein